MIPKLTECLKLFESLSTLKIVLVAENKLPPGKSLSTNGYFETLNNTLLSQIMNTKESLTR